MAPRLPPLAFQDWDDEVRTALGVLLPPERINAEGAGNVLGTLAHNAALTRSFLAFNRYILRESSLPERLREVAIMRVAQLRRSPYLWSHHVPLARRAGLTDRDIAGIAAGALADPADMAVLGAVDDLENHCAITDSTWDALARHLDDRQRMDLVFTAGCYSLLAVTVNTYRIEDETG